MVVSLLFISSIFVSADHTIYINGSSSVLKGLFSENYAIGSGGTDLLGADDVYVLTAGGISSISSSPAEGGGGLLYDDGSVKIKSNVIKVGLSFNFNRGNMDTTVESATFSNTNGTGFLFGYYDSTRQFVELASTEENTVSVYGLDPESMYLGVYNSAGELLYMTDYPNTKENLIAIHPVCLSGDSVTSYNSYRYFGDFEVGYTAGEGITVINTVNLEQYIVGVTTAEMVVGAPIDAYKAQAIAARTYAQRCIKNTDLYDYYGFDLTNNTYYQAYFGYYAPSQSIYKTIKAAVEETQNQYLTYNGSLINAMYTAANGGMVLDGGYPYLISFEDPYEGDSWTKGLYGHGCGMSQWGAYSMAKYHNKDYKSILGFYYAKVGISYGYM